MTRRRSRRIPVCLSALILSGVAIAAWRPASALAGEDDAREFQRLDRQLRQEYNAAKYEAAMKTAEKMHELRPDWPQTSYNIACLHCLMGDKAKAYEWLEKAVDSGYRDVATLQNDYDFRTIWGEDRFRGILKRIREEIAGAPVASEGGGAKKPDQPVKKAEDAAKDMTPRQRLDRVQALTQEVIAASEKKQLDRALKLAQEAHEMALGANSREALSLTKYNVACMYSLLNEKKQALDHLEAALEAGAFAPNMVRQIEQDKDFDNIREEPRYKRIVEKAGKAAPSKPAVSQSLVTLPRKHDASKPAPLLVVLHGRGGNMHEVSERWQPIADKLGAIILAPQGTLQIAENQYRWNDDLDLVEHDVLDELESVMERYKIDDDRVIIAGFSQGAAAAYGLAVRNPEVFAGVIAIAGRFSASLESEADADDLVDLRVVIMIGEKDSAEALEDNRRAEAFFKKVKAAVRFKAYPGLRHEYPKETEKELTKAAEWILE